MVYFGYPVAHEDDAQRAVRAGLDIVGAVGDLSIRLQAEQDVVVAVRVGIQTGLVVAGEVGGADTRGDMAVVGETPNIAARIEGLAAPGTVVVGDRTRRLVGDVFDFEDLGSHDLRGLSVPMILYRAKAERAADSRFEAMHPAGLTPFVGRDEEIGLLLSRWGAAKSGEGQVVLLEGEPGIGKSRITGTFRELIAPDDHTRLQYQCSPFHTNSAFHPFVTQLERAARFADDDTSDGRLDKLEALIGADDPEALSLLAALLSLPIDRYPPLAMSPQKLKERTVEVLVEQIAKLALQTPILMIFEDAHWVDPTSLEVLDHVIAAIGAHPVLLVVTFRPEFEPHWGAHSHITLHSLNRLGIRQSGLLVERVTAGKPLPTELSNQIITKTDGVPLFIEELTKAVIESDIVSDEGDRYALSGAIDSLAIPDTLHDSLMARLDKLIPVKEVAQVGAAIGREFSYQLIAALSPLSEPDLDAALDKLIDSELVHSRGTPPNATYTFKHALVQDAAYDSMLKRDRQNLHQRIAEALIENLPAIAETEPELLAHHYTAANLADMAVPKWLSAGQLAVARFAHPEALGHLKSGLDLIDRLAESLDRDRTELAFHMAIASAYSATEGWASDNTKLAYDRAEPIIRRLGGDESVFDTMIGIYYYYNVSGQMDKGEPIIRDAVRYADKQGTAAQKLVAYQALGQNTWYRGAFAESVESLQTSMSFYDRTEHAVLANVWGVDFYASDHAWLGSTYWLIGKPEQASLAVDRARAHAQLMEQPHTVAWVEAITALARLVQGEHDLAVTTAISAREKSGAIEFKIMEAIAWWVAGAARISRGERDDGIAELERGLEMWADLGGRAYVPWVSTILAVGYAQDKRFNEARALIDDAVEQAATDGEIWSDASIEECRAKISLLAGDDRGAMKQFQKALRISEQLGSPSLALRMAIHIARLSEPEEVRAILAPHYDWFTEGFDTPDLKDAKALLEELK
jgi:tetratricopeptide (TPR) repeat protein